jgi:hypothetical protein
MKKQILSEQFKRMQKLAGILNEEETQKNNPFGKVVYHGS